MRIFGKKENEFNDEESLNEGRKIKNKLKDLNPENKRKRKEPTKPWGRKERLIILVVLLVTTTVSAILLFKHSLSSGLIVFNFDVHTIKFDLKSFNIFKGETIIINKK